MDVLITDERHRELLGNTFFLTCLVESGVEDWNGFQYALNRFEQALLSIHSPEEVKAMVLAQEKR